MYAFIISHIVYLEYINSVNNYLSVGSSRFDIMEMPDKCACNQHWNKDRNYIKQNRIFTEHQNVQRRIYDEVEPSTERRTVNKGEGTVVPHEYSEQFYIAMGPTLV